MSTLTTLVQYVLCHPTTWMVSGNFLTVYILLLRHKSKTTRDLDERLQQLRRERGNIYSAVRPLQ